MLILLPPSETKRPGGSGGPVALDSLAFPQLLAQRELVIGAIEALSTDAATAARVLKLGTTQLWEVVVNAAIRTSPTLCAVDRYTGVLYDALNAASLDGAALRWLGRRVLIHSAPFGPIGALDAIPAYRLGAATSVPGLPALRRLWADPIVSALRDAAPRFVLDLRSEAYVALGPVPPGIPSVFVRVVAEGGDGTVRALNHFNKHAKGDLVRRLTLERPRISSRAAFARWADSAGVRVRDAGSGELELFV